MQVNVVSATVVLNCGMDLIVMDTDDMPSPCPAVTQTPCQFTVYAAMDTGVQYVRDNLGIEPTVVPRGTTYG